jgi:hypothetical protein
MLFLVRRGVPSMVGNWVLYVAIWERKLDTDSSKPALEPGLLPGFERPLELSD